MAKSDDKPSSSANPTGIDAMSPYYLHASDNPGDVYVSELLHDGNYADWRSEMANALYAKNKIGFVDGSLEMPDAKSPNFLMWKRCNAMVIGWLRIAMDKELRNSVKAASTARQIWQDLEERFGNESAPRAYEIRRTLAQTRQNGQSISAYYTKLKALWDAMQSASRTPCCKCGKCDCEVPKQLAAAKEKEQLYELLMGLDESFSVIRTQILSTKPTPTLGMAYHLLSEDEKHRQIAAYQQPSVDGAAFHVQQPMRGQAVIDATALQAQQNNDRRGPRRERPRCTHCQKLGHLRDNCYELVGYPSERRKNQQGGGWRKEGIWERKPSPRAANVMMEESPIPGVSSDQYEKMMQFFVGQGGGTSSINPSNEPLIDMAGLSCEDPDWLG